MRKPSAVATNACEDGASTPEVTYRETVFEAAGLWSCLFGEEAYFPSLRFVPSTVTLRAAGLFEDGSKLATEILNALRGVSFFYLG